MVQAIINDRSTTIFLGKAGVASHNPLINPYAVQMVALEAIGQSWRNLSATISKNAKEAKEDDRDRQDRLSDLKASEELTTYLNAVRLHCDIYTGNEQLLA